MSPGQSKMENWLLEAVVFSVFLAILPLSIYLNYFTWQFHLYGKALVVVGFLWAVFVDKSPFNGVGNPSLAVRRATIWHHIRNYFPAKMYQEEPLDSDKTYLFAAHPHGIIGLSVWVNFLFDTTGVSQKNNNIDIAIGTLSTNFYIPLWREFVLAVGFVDASFGSLLNCLKKKRSVTIVVGGAAEALDAHVGTNDLTLIRRRGFVRLALSAGAQLVPVYTFGENNLYWQISNPKGSLLRRVQDKVLKVFTFSTPLCAGIGLLPRRAELHTVIGKPIPLPKIENPTKNDIEKFHAIYRRELRGLFDRYKHKYAPDRKGELVFVE